MKDYSSDTEKTVTILKDTISQKGYDYIYDNAHKVHRVLIEKGIDKSIADVTLYALAAGIARGNKSNIRADTEEKLRENPFLKAEDIRSFYEEEIHGIICSEFDDYCTSDDYYPPVVEDFPGNIHYYMDKFLPEHGLEMTDDDYECDESDIY